MTANIKLGAPSGGSVQLTPTDTSGNYTVSLPATTDTLLVRGDGASNAVYTPAGVGAVATTVQSKLRDSVSVKDFGAVGDGVTDDSAAIQAAHDAIVATGKKGRLLLTSGTYKCNSGLTINSLYVSIDAAGASLDFSGLVVGTALTVTEHDLIDLGGLRITGNSNAGVVNGVKMVGTAGHQVDSVRMRNLVCQTFGTGMLLGDNCYLVTFDNVIITDCTININSNGTTNAGSSIKFYGGNLINQVSGGTIFKNTNPTMDAYFFGTVFDGTGKNIELTAGSVELHGCHIEPSDFLVTPIVLTGSTTRFNMIGGEVTAGASPTTANALVSCDSTCVHGAQFDSAVLLSIITATKYLFEGTGAANCRTFGAISANRHSLLGNALADGGFENGSVLYGSADGTSNFADLVSITVDTGSLPANNLVTGANLALTFSTTFARTGTKSLKLVKSAALAAPAAFGIFRELPKGGRPSGRIWYKKPGAETGTMSISMGFYKVQLDTNGVPRLQKQSITLATTAVFTAAAVDWTESSLFDLYAPPWATHYAISINAGSMNPCSIYFDDAEISIL